MLKAFNVTTTFMYVFFFLVRIIFQILNFKTRCEAQQTELNVKNYAKNENDCECID